MLAEAWTPEGLSRPGSYLIHVKVAVCLCVGVVEVVDVEENGWKVRSLVGYQVEVLRTQNRGGIL